MRNIRIGVVEDDPASCQLVLDVILTTKERACADRGISRKSARVLQARRDARDGAQVERLVLLKKL